MRMVGSMRDRSQESYWQKRRQQLYSAGRSVGDLERPFALASLEPTDGQAQGFAEFEAKSRKKRSAG